MVKKSRKSRAAKRLRTEHESTALGDVVVPSSIGRLLQKRRIIEQQQTTTHPDCVSGDGNGDDQQESSERELSSCESVLRHLSASGGKNFMDRRYKAVRSAIYGLIDSGVLSSSPATRGPNNVPVLPSLTERITSSLRNGDYDVAIQDLEKLRRSSTTRLAMGTVCRWVRECDYVEGAAAGTLDADDDGGRTRAGRAGAVTVVGPLAALDAILRASDPDQIGTVERGSIGLKPSILPANGGGASIRHYPEWIAVPHPPGDGDREETPSLSSSNYSWLK